MNRKPELGFTLTELMVTVAVAAILLAIGTPSFRDALVRYRLTTLGNTFMATLNYARSEAIRRGQSITVCKSGSGTACQTGTGTQWESGWIAFLDNDADGTLDTGETLLRAWPALPSPYTLRPNTNFSNFLRYDPQGAANNIGSFAVCHNSEEKGAKAIVITRLRPRLGMDGDNDEIPETDNGDIGSCENP